MTAEPYRGNSYLDVAYKWSIKTACVAHDVIDLYERAAERSSKSGST